MKFCARLREIGFSTYAEYLNSETWQNFRFRYRKSKHPKTCAVCGDSDIELHHRTYKRIGRERLTDVVPLCRAHHYAVHEWMDRNGVDVDFTDAAVDSIRSKAPIKPERKDNRKKERKLWDGIPQSKITETLVWIRRFPLTDKQRAALNRFVSEKRGNDIYGMWKSLTHTGNGEGRGKKRKKRAEAAYLKSQQKHDIRNPVCLVKMLVASIKPPR